MRLDQQCIEIKWIFDDASLGKGDQVNLTENDAISCFVH